MYFPFPSVLVPTDVPFTVIVTPGIGFPSSSAVTVPVIFVCAKTKLVVVTKNNNKSILCKFLITIKKLYLIKKKEFQF